MSACPDLTPQTESEDELVREAEVKALRRLAKLTESEDERVALRAATVLVKYAIQRRREEARATPAKTEAKPPVAIPRGLVEPPRPAPAFRAVPPSAVAGLREVSGASSDRGS